MLKCKLARMMFMRVEKYSKINAICWDDFVSKAKNGHFLFYRDYMEYHRDRFCDFSMIIYNDKGNIIALLPASIDGDTVISHGGLTFGGFVCDSKMTAAKMLDVFANVKQFLKNAGVRMFIYKCMPALYTIDIRLMKLYMHCFVIMQNYIGEMCHFLFICQID